MASLYETQSLIDQKKQEISQAKENVSKIKGSIPQTSQAQLRGQKSPSGLAGRDLQRKLKSSREQVTQAEEQIGQYEQGVKEYETQLQSYQGTESGKLQYAKENNLSPSSYIQWRPYTNYALVQIPVYSTPYGDVVDFEMQNRLSNEAGRTEATVSAQTFEKQAFVGGLIGATSAEGLEGIDVNKFLRGEQKINRGSSEFEVKGDSVFKTELSETLPTQQDYNKILSPSSSSGIQARENYKKDFGMFATVSASSFDSSDKSLSSQGVNNINDNVNVPSRVSNGFIGGLWSGVTNFIGDSSDLEKGRQAEKTFTLGNQTFTRVTASPMKETISYVNGQPTPRTSIVETTNWVKPSFTKFVTEIPTKVGKVVGTGFVTALDVPYVLSGGRVGYIPETKTLAPEVKTMTLPYQTRGTSYTDNKGRYFTPKTITKINERRIVENPIRTKARVTGQIIGETATIGAATLNPVTDIVLLGSYGVEGTKQVLNKDLPIGQRVISGGQVVLSVGFLGLKGVKYGFEPIVKNTKPQTVNMAFDVIEPTAQGTEKGRFALYQYSFGGKQTVTNRVRQLFKLEPKRIINIKPEMRVAVSTEIITKEGEIINNPLIFSAKQGKNYGKISTLAGKQENVAIENIETLPKTQQFTLQKLAEAKAGRPVSMKFVKDILGKDIQVSRGILESRDILKVSSKNIVKRIPYGKTRTIGETGSTSELLSSTPNSEIYLTETSLKDVTKPFSRASGKKNMITGLSIVKSPTQVEEATGTILKLKTSPKSIQTIKQAESLVSKTLPKPRTPKINLPKSKLLPLVEATEVKVGVRTSELPIQTTRVTELPQQKSEAKLESSLINKVETKTNQVEVLKNINLPKQIENTLMKQPSQSKEVLKFNEKQIESLKFETKQQQKLQNKQVSKQIIKPKSTIKPKEAIIKIPIKTSLPQRLAKKITSEPDMFEVFTRKGGQDISIGKTTSKEKAKDILFGRISSTARASGFVEQGGRRLKVSELGSLGSNFGKSKKDEFRIIELKNKRIKRGTQERAELMSFKKVKGKKLFGF